MQALARGFIVSFRCLDHEGIHVANCSVVLLYLNVLIVRPDVVLLLEWLLGRKRGNLLRSPEVIEIEVMDVGGLSSLRHIEVES